MCSERAKEELKKTLCNKCFNRYQDWSDEIYNSWLLYIKGADRKDIIKNTYFSNFKSIYQHFKKHECYKKIAKTRKLWFRPTKKFEHIELNKYPWLMGLFYADGTISASGTKLAFYLSLHEKIIANEVVENLQDLTGSKKPIAIDKIGNMYGVRYHSLELCEKFPNKKDSNAFIRLWKGFNEKERMRFLAGFVDGDGSCAFEDGINSIQIYNKDQPFVLDAFYSFLKQYGYVSVQKNKIYISPEIGVILKPFTIKRYIKKPYKGAVDVDKALKMLRNGVSVYKISKRMGFDKKTVYLALKRVYGKKLIEEYFKTNKTKRQNTYSGSYDLDYIFKMLKTGRSLNSLVNYRNHTHVKQCLFKIYGENKIKPHIRRKSG